MSRSSVAETSEMYAKYANKTFRSSVCSITNKAMSRESNGITTGLPCSAITAIKCTEKRIVPRRESKHSFTYKSQSDIRYLMVERQEVDQQQPGEHKKVARDLINGCLAGAIGIYLTQPFDTVRVRALAKMIRVD